MQFGTGTIGGGAGGAGDVSSARTIATTAPLAGGGNLSANRTLSITPATTAAAGSMSSTDKLKVDRLGLVGKTLYVDAANGVNATAARGHAEQPYLTITAALAAASSGDTIVVRPGTYNERNLLKNGVNQHYENGAVINWTGTGPGAIFDTGTTGTNAAVTCRITGHGRFTHSAIDGVVDEATGERNVVLLTQNTGDDIYVQCHSMEFGWDPSAGIPFPHCIRTIHGTVKVDVEILDPHNAGGSIWWSDGDCRIRAREIRLQSVNFAANAFAVWSTPGTTESFIDATYTTGALWVEAETIGGDDASAVGIVACYGTNSARVWINAQEIVGEAAQGIISVAGSRVYITAHKITNRGATPNPHIQVNGGEFWGRFSKLGTSGPGVGGGIWYATAGPGSQKIWVDVQHFDDSAGGATLIKASGSSGGGAAVIHVRDAVMSATGAGIVFDGGTLRFSGKINVAANASVDGATVSSSGLTLENATIITDAAKKCVNAGSAKNVQIYGALTSNVAKGANITFKGGALTTDAALV